MRTIPSELFSQLHSLEQSLLEPEIRNDTQAVSALLDDDFREVGASGRIYTRSEILDRLSGLSSDERLTMSEFAVAIVTRDLHGNQVAMTNYITTHNEPGKNSMRRARRTSVWMRSDSTWRMRFHQGMQLD